jgi:hypothetical protein
MFDNGRVLHFGNPDSERRAAADSDILADLSHLALLRAEGAEAQTFLQGQLSNDIRQVSEARTQLSAYCNPKGRMLAIFHIIQRGEAYYLQLPAELAESTLKRLRLFILRAKVKLEPADAELARIGLSGPRADALLRGLLGNAPANAYDCLTVGEVTVIRLPGPHARFELLAPPARLIPIAQALATHTTRVGAGPWAWLDIMAGIPAILPGTVEEFVPQMANLELVGGVSFNKGCYPGQEIVARMHYLGRLKQRLYRAHVTAPSAPRPGDKLYAPGSGEQAAGQVVDAQAAPAGGQDLLAVIQIEAVIRGELRLGGLEGEKLALRDLPYDLPAAPAAN